MKKNPKPQTKKTRKKKKNLPPNQKTFPPQPRNKRKKSHAGPCICEQTLRLILKLELIRIN